MPMPALLLLLATLLPLASYGLLLVMGRRLGNPLAGWLATAFIGASLALSLAGTVAWFNGGQLAGIGWGPGDKPILLSARWLPIGSVDYAQEHPGFLVHLLRDLADVVGLLVGAREGRAPDDLPLGLVKIGKILVKPMTRSILVNTA